MQNDDIKSIYLNKDFRTGGFYELCIQVSASLDTETIKIYHDFFWNKPEILGPYDENFNKIELKFDYKNEGVLKLEETQIPFCVFIISEDITIETGSLWFDISFYITTIEKVFNMTPLNWDEEANCPLLLKNYLLKLMKELYNLKEFKLALIDFEISGEYQLEEMNDPNLINWSNSKFYIGRKNENKVHKNNIKDTEFI